MSPIGDLSKSAKNAFPKLPKNVQEEAYLIFDDLLRARNRSTIISRHGGRLIDRAKRLYAFQFAQDYEMVVAFDSDYCLLVSVEKK